MNEKTEGTFKIPKKKEPVIKTDEQKRAAIKEPLINTKRASGKHRKACKLYGRDRWQYSRLHAFKYKL